MKKILISLVLLIGFSLSLSAQEKSSKEKRGDKFFFIYAYDRAIDKYSITKQLTVPGQRNLAESYWVMQQNAESEETYTKMLKAGKDLMPLDYYNYAMVLKSSGKYDESNVQMDEFAAQMPNDLRVKSYLENKTQFVTISTDAGAYKIREMSVNTASQDFGTSFFNENQVVYASSNSQPKMVKRSDNFNHEPYLNLYIADVENEQLKNPKYFDKKENTRYNDGPASFSNSGTFMAYTVNKEKDKSADNIVELQIYFRSFENDKWSEPVAFSHNNPAYSLGHPSLTSDGKTMYFVSDEEGGFGGSDIYKTTKGEDGSWSEPENLGDIINTEGNELFPFFEEEKKILHFASNGHFGLGGLDIFSSPMNGESWGKVTNAGAPLNSRYDDYALIVNDKTSKGFFSSNRADGSGSDDIYGVDFLEVRTKIIGVAKDLAHNLLPGTTVRLFNEKDSLISMLTADANGAYEFVVESDKKFKLTGNKEYYSEAKNIANTFGTSKIVTADLELILEEIIVEEEDVDIHIDDIIVDEDLGAKIKLKSIYFEYNKSDITPKAAEELDKMVKVMNQHPQIEIRLSAYTDCRGTKDFNETLSQERAKSSSDYIKARITNPERLYGKGYGETNLATDCPCEGKTASPCSSDDHQKNRRTEFIVVKKNSLTIEE